MGEETDFCLQTRNEGKIDGLRSNNNNDKQLTKQCAHLTFRSRIVSHGRSCRVFIFTRGTFSALRCSMFISEI